MGFVGTGNADRPPRRAPCHLQEGDHHRDAHVPNPADASPAPGSTTTNSDSSSNSVSSPPSRPRPPAEGGSLQGILLLHPEIHRPRSLRSPGAGRSASWPVTRSRHALPRYPATGRSRSRRLGELVGHLAHEELWGVEKLSWPFSAWAEPCSGCSGRSLAKPTRHADR